MRVVPLRPRLLTGTHRSFSFNPDPLDLLPRSTYFQSLHSERRADFLRDVGERVIASAQLPSRLSDLPELALYRCFAADGHWHKPAVHDPKVEGPGPAIGHFYALDLSTYLLRHLAVAAEPHEHDMSVLKRLQPRACGTTFGAAPAS